MAAVFKRRKMTRRDFIVGPLRVIPAAPGGGGGGGSGTQLDFSLSANSGHIVTIGL